MFEFLLHSVYNVYATESKTSISLLIALSPLTISLNIIPLFLLIGEALYVSYSKLGEAYWKHQQIQKAELTILKRQK